MKLPGNSLGISDAKQFEACPMLFHENMKRHTAKSGRQDYEGYSPVLAFGNALHEAAEEIVAMDGEIYLDDAVERAWARWGRHVPNEMFEELVEDCKTVIARSQDAKNLELIACEEDHRVAVFVGEKDPEKQMLDEENETYFYRFKIDALYRDKNDPSHFIVRDFKTVRKRRTQSEVDEDIQLTAYDYGVRELYGNQVKKVTIWYDQVKFEPLFTSRDNHDRRLFETWIISQIKQVLDAPEEAVANTPKLNDHCAWCPLLESCGIVEIINDVHLAKIAARSGRIASETSMDEYVEVFQEAKQSIKALKEYEKRIGDWLKENNGEYAGKQYTTTFVNRTVWKPRDLYQIFGDKAFDMLTPVAKGKIGADNFKEASQELEHTATIVSGGERLNAK